MTLPRVFPIFPLAEVILVPGALLPLHIFEPRYRAMVADTLEGERLMAMALPLTVAESEDTGAAPVHPVCGLGRIVRHEPYPDGRCNILLEGVARMHIEREVTSDKLYRQVIAHPLEDLEIAEEEFASQAVDLLARIPGLSDKERAQTAALPLPRMLDVVLLRLSISVPEKYRLFAMTDPAERLSAMQGVLDRLEEKLYPFEIRDRDPRLN